MILDWEKVIRQLEELLKIVRAELPRRCWSTARITPFKNRVGMDLPQQFVHLTDSQKLVAMFARKTQGVHVLVPPELDVEKRGWVLYEKRDRDGNQVLLFPFGEAEIKAQQLGQDLASFI